MDKTKKELNKARSKNEDFHLGEWHAERTFVYDPFGNVVCECYQLGCLDPEYSWGWARHNASTIAFLHNDRLEKDKIISQAKPID